MYCVVYKQANTISSTPCMHTVCVNGMEDRATPAKHTKASCCVWLMGCEAHLCELLGRPRVHLNRTHEAEVHSQTAVHTGALEAHKDTVRH